MCPFQGSDGVHAVRLKCFPGILDRERADVNVIGYTCAFPAVTSLQQIFSSLSAYSAAAIKEEHPGQKHTWLYLV